MKIKTQDLLYRHIKDLPYFRGFLRAVESRFYDGLTLERPILDLGCGDGHFAEVTFAERIDVGLDPWHGPIQEAGTRDMYDKLYEALGSNMPFPDGMFGSCISNSVLEHIPDLDAVLKETNRVLRPGAYFVFCVPNQRFLSTLSVSNFFDRVGLKFFGNIYRAFFNTISRHHTCESQTEWTERLAKAGFQVENAWDYFSPASLRRLEWGHYFGFPSLILHFFTRKWNLVTARWNFAWLERFLRANVEETVPQSEGVYTFFVARKIAS